MSIFIFKFTKATRGGYLCGYNCSLYINNKKVQTVKGGGFDIKGVVLSNYLKDKHTQHADKIPDGAIGFNTIKEWFEKLEGKELKFISASKNNNEIQYQTTN